MSTHREAAALPSRPKSPKEICVMALLLKFLRTSVSKEAQGWIKSGSLHAQDGGGWEATWDRRELGAAIAAAHST